MDSQSQECTTLVIDVPEIGQQTLTLEITQTSTPSDGHDNNSHNASCSNLNQISSNSDNILVPGYLLVKSGLNENSYEVRETVMSIKMNNRELLMENQQTYQLEITTSSPTTTSNNYTFQSSKHDETILTPHNVISLTTDDKNNDCDQIVLSIDEKQEENANSTDNNNHGIVFDMTQHDSQSLISQEQEQTLQLIASHQKNHVTPDEDNVACLDGGKKTKKVPPSRLLRVNCPVCSKEFKKTYLKEHMKIHDEDMQYKCNVCGKKYRWRTLLRNHKKTHLTNNPFTCPICDLRMSSKFSVQQHVLKVHENGEKNFSCSNCDKKYVTIHQLRAHEKFHAQDRTRQCEFCGKVYKHIASLERHRRVHKGEENSMDLRLKCSSCGLICHSKTHYTAHQRIHTGEKPFQCETCGKSYRQIAQLNQHKIVHTTLRPFKCTLCERTFRCRSNLQLHLDHHKGEKRHSCSHCGQKFFSYPNMLKHIRRNHLGLRPHKCQVCDKSFCEKQELQNHARTHSGEKRPQPMRKRLPLPTPDNKHSNGNNDTSN